jgi:hypothetical protein
MKTRSATLLLVAWAGIVHSPAAAWTPKTRVGMIDEATTLMPASLRLVLEHHRSEVLRGMLEPLAHEDDPSHLPPESDGTLDAHVAAAASELTRAVGEQRSFKDVSRRFGTLAHFVADAGFPPGVGGDAANARYADFSGFCETRRSRFPLVFYGHEEPSLGIGDFRSFAKTIIARAREEDEILARAYAAAGIPPDPIAFDDRSVPFAVASIAYSRSVTDIVRAWLTAWKDAYGDLGRTPYLESAP